jgi:2-haloacid dehalogenase
MASIKALTFDTGGTILNWHAGIRDVLSEVGTSHGLERDWAALTNEYRMASLMQMVNAGKDAPATFNIDDVHREQLDVLIENHDLQDFSDAEKDSIWFRWHELDCWQGFPEVQARLRTKYKVASFTILTVALIMDTAKKNGLSWDAVISCEMIGKYKMLPEAYQTAAQWLAIDPSEIMMVASHNIDLNAARECGFKSAYIHRPTEWGPQVATDAEPDSHHDIIAKDDDDLARQLGV